jgi:hypothetical protein
MKTLALVFVLALCAGSRLASSTAPAIHEHAAITSSGPCVDDPPPPLECPMCGGNIELHRRRTKAMAEVRAIGLLAWMTTH